MMTNARQFVYQYDDKNEPEEIVIDMRGEHKIPSKGCIITAAPSTPAPTTTPKNQTDSISVACYLKFL
jgi:hypothetical protein